jgi:uncharacterized protein (TIGR00255 family)
MLSMTGYGFGESTVGSYTVTVELRSVNHRFLDTVMKLPSVMALHEIDIRNRIKSDIARGRITCAIQLDRDGAEEAMKVSDAKIDQGLDLLQQIADRYEARQLPRPQVDIESLLAIPDFFKPAGAQENDEEIRSALDGAMGQAIEGLKEMKRIEGAETVTEMSQRLDKIAVSLARVNELVPAALEEAKQRLRERLDQIIDESLDPQRLAQEAAILVDKSNINEECERLSCHLDQYRSTMQAGGQVAKRLNFLLQEMHREVNTMGSKTQNMEITDSVIAMKDEIESMREQSLNLE